MIRLRELPPSHRDNDVPALRPPTKGYDCAGNVSHAMCADCGERVSAYLCDAKTPRGTCDMPMCGACRLLGATPTQDLCFAHRSETTAR